MILAQLKVRIFDNANNIAEGIFNGPNLDPFPNVLHRLVSDRAEFDEFLESGFRIFDAPISNCAVGSVVGRRILRLDAEFISAHIEADVERLIEVRLDSEDFAVPLLALFNVADVINGCA